MVSTTEDTGVLDAVRRVVDDTTADRVFGTPVMQGDVIMLPVARIAGGGGGGSGSSPGARQVGAESQQQEGAQQEGTGGGFGVSAKPLGVFVLRGGHVSWRPAIDVNRIVLGGQLVAVTALLVARSLARARHGGPRLGKRHRGMRAMTPQAKIRREIDRLSRR